LGGDGSDELFAGYDTFRILQAARWYARLVPKTLHAVFRFAARMLPMSARNMSFDFKVRRGLRGLSYSQPLWNSVWHGALEPKDIADLFGHHVSLEDLYSEALDVW